MNNTCGNCVHFGKNPLDDTLFNFPTVADTPTEIKNANGEVIDIKNSLITLCSIVNVNNPSCCVFEMKK